MSLLNFNTLTNKFFKLKKYIIYENSDAQHALMDGELECKPEYKLMVRCAEAEWKNRGGYWKQLRKELDPISKKLMK